jgi:hypothetical protein
MATPPLAPSRRQTRAATSSPRPPPTFPHQYQHAAMSPPPPQPSRLSEGPDQATSSRHQPPSRSRVYRPGRLILPPLHTNAKCPSGPGHVTFTSTTPGGHLTCKNNRQEEVRGSVRRSDVGVEGRRKEECLCRLLCCRIVKFFEWEEQFIQCICSILKTILRVGDIISTDNVIS